VILNRQVQTVGTLLGFFDHRHTLVHAHDAAGGADQVDEGSRVVPRPAADIED